ncbi:MAG: sigma-70 family RNA polymerase sigma factor [Anaerolineales bacterium]|nr:sigma-70 family RNA polymerase sigma factor [Anaerolineales bacterium]
MDPETSIDDYSLDELWAALRSWCESYMAWCPDPRLAPYVLLQEVLWSVLPTPVALRYTSTMAGLVTDLDKRFTQATRVCMWRILNDVPYWFLQERRWWDIRPRVGDLPEGIRRKWEEEIGCSEDEALLLYRVRAHDQGAAWELIERYQDELKRAAWDWYNRQMTPDAAEQPGDYQSLAALISFAHLFGHTPDIIRRTVETPRGDQTEEDRAVTLAPDLVRKRYAFYRDTPFKDFVAVVAQRVQADIEQGRIEMPLSRAEEATRLGDPDTRALVDHGNDLRLSTYSMTLARCLDPSIAVAHDRVANQARYNPLRAALAPSLWTRAKQGLQKLYERRSKSAVEQGVRISKQARQDSIEGTRDTLDETADIPDLTTDILDALERKELGRRVAALMADLAPLEQAVWALKADGVKEAEIAQRLSEEFGTPISVDEVRSAWRRAQRRVRKAMSEGRQES